MNRYQNIKTFFNQKILCYFLFLILQFSLFASYPDYTDLYINDFAAILTQEDQISIKKHLQLLKTESDIEAVLLTINSYESYNTGDETFEAFATGLFNYWGIGDKQKNNGILILFSLEDRKVRIELGSGYSRSYDQKMKYIIDNNMIPQFKNGQYNRGLNSGIMRIYESFIEPVSQEFQEVPGEQDSRDIQETLDFENFIEDIPQYGNDYYEMPQSMNSIPSLIFWLILIGIIGGGAFKIISRILRYRPRICLDCKVQMDLLDELQDNKYLNESERKEEELQSVDYDIWSCPQCHKTILKRYNKFFSGYRGCAKCGYRTMKVTRRVIRPATYSSSGRGLESGFCHACRHHYERSYHIARLQRSSSSSSSSSSSGSFGGGSSSGGGASGSW